MLQISSPFTMIFVIVFVVVVGGVINTIVGHVRKFGQHQQELDFKREMVERGLSIEEIERLLRMRSVEDE
jgi:hypothetical protein